LDFTFSEFAGLYVMSLGSGPGLPSNLKAPSFNPSDPRPHQRGKAKGRKGGIPVSGTKEWLIDTGAQISCITKSNGAQFDLTPVAGSANGTAGGGGMLVKTGLTMEFEIFDTVGLPKAVSCSLKVAVKPDDRNSEVLGMDQLKNVNAAVEWDPGAQNGRMYEV
jgi:hypothetical protein